MDHARQPIERHRHDSGNRPTSSRIWQGQPLWFLFASAGTTLNSEGPSSDDPFADAPRFAKKRQDRLDMAWLDLEPAHSRPIWSQQPALRVVRHRVLPRSRDRPRILRERQHSLSRVPPPDVARGGRWLRPRATFRGSGAVSPAHECVHRPGDVDDGAIGERARWWRTQGGALRGPERRPRGGVTRGRASFIDRASGLCRDQRRRNSMSWPPAAGRTRAPVPHSAVALRTNIRAAW